MADLTIVVDVRDEQTMSSYKIPRSGKLVYKNASKDFDLTVSQKRQNPLPLCESNGNVEIELPLVVPKDTESRDLRICNSFKGQEFLYTAQIGMAAEEDPIVIIDKKKDASFDPLAAAILGASLGAAATYLIVKSRANKMRPQQG
jgi:hypothetical protein